MVIDAVHPIINAPTTTKSLQRSCFDIVAKNGNIVEATFDIVAFDNVASTLLLVWTGLKVVGQKVALPLQLGKVRIALLRQRNREAKQRERLELERARHTRNIIANRITEYLYRATPTCE